MELPQTVTLKVIETEPGIKGATAAAQTKPATLETGLVVQVPVVHHRGRADRHPDRGRQVPPAGEGVSRVTRSPRTAARGLCLRACSMSPLITLTTDFGDASPYVAVMKGVILSINPAARLLDLSHRIRAAGRPPRRLLPRHRCPVLPGRARSTSRSSTPASGRTAGRSCIEAGGQLPRRPGQRRLHPRGPGPRRAGPRPPPDRAAVLAAGRSSPPSTAGTCSRRSPPTCLSRPTPPRLGPVVDELVELKTALGGLLAESLRRRGAVRGRVRQPDHEHPGGPGEVAAGAGVARMGRSRGRSGGCGPTPMRRRGTS